MLDTTHRPGSAWAWLVLLWLLACPTLALAQSRPEGERVPQPGKLLKESVEGLTDDVPFTIAVVGGGTALLFVVLALMHRWRHRPRPCARCHSPRTLLHDLEDDFHLEPGEQVEEKMGSVDYDVWWCDHCLDVEVLPHRPLYTPYLRCDRCRYTTVKQSTSDPIRGRFGDMSVRVTLSCHHCHHTSSFMRSYERS